MKIIQKEVIISLDQDEINALIYGMQTFELYKFAADTLEFVDEKNKTMKKTNVPKARQLLDKLREL
jgi:hypothetical protein